MYEAKMMNEQADYQKIRGGNDEEKMMAEKMAYLAKLNNSAQVSNDKNRIMGQERYPKNSLSNNDSTIDDQVVYAKSIVPDKLFKLTNLNNSFNSDGQDGKIADLQDRLDKLILAQRYRSDAPPVISNDKSDSSNNMLIYVVVGFLTLIILIIIFLVMNQQK